MKPDATIEPEVLTVEQFCVTSTLGKTKIYELIATGALKTRRLGRRRLILVSDARTFLETLPTE